MENIDIEIKLTQVKGFALQRKLEEALALASTLDDTSDMGGIVCFTRGNIYMQMGQFSLADENYNLAINKGFVDFRLYINLAAVNMYTGKTQRAELLYRQAAELDPTEVFPLNMICQLRLQAGDLSGAIAVAEEITQRHPSLIDGFKLNLTIMLELGMYEDAKMLLLEIENRFSAHPDYILLRSLVVSKLETPDAALKYLTEKESSFFDEEAKARYTREQARCRNNAGLALIAEATKHKDMQEVLRLSSELIATDAPRSITFVYILLSRAGAFWELGDKTEYRKTMEQIIDVLNDAGDALGLEMRMMRASVYEQLEQYTEAVAALDDAAEFVKDNSDMLGRIAEKRAEVSAKIGFN